MAGGGNNRAADQARRDEEARAAAIRNTQGRINQVFDSPQRAADIADAVGAYREYGLQDLDRQKTVADRQSRFALASRGLIGGSVQNDQQAEFGRQYSRGVLDIERAARGVGAGIEATDQENRARLISLATTGLDATTGAQQAAASMRTALEAGRSGSQMQGLSDVFGQFAKYYEDSRIAKRNREADQRAFGLYSAGGLGP